LPRRSILPPRTKKSPTLIDRSSLFRPRRVAPGFGSGSNVVLAGSDLSANATPDMKRTADYWAAMDPENAAKVVVRLPTPYVARILALMPPEAAGTILDNLPPSFAAKLTQEKPELKR
jgi:hypothetical protein